MRKFIVSIIALAMVFTSFVVVPFAPKAYAATDVSVEASYTIDGMSPSSLPTTDAIRGKDVVVTATFTVGTAVSATTDIPVVVKVFSDVTSKTIDATVTFANGSTTATAQFTITGVDTRVGGSDFGKFGKYLKVSITGSTSAYSIAFTSDKIWTPKKVTISGLASSYKFQQNVQLQGSVKDEANNSLSGVLGIVHLGTPADQDAFPYALLDTTSVVSGLYVIADFEFSKTGYYEAVFADNGTVLSNGYYSVGATTFADAKFVLLAPTGNLQQGEAYVFKAKYYSEQHPYTNPDGPLYIYDQSNNLIETINAQTVYDASVGGNITYYAKVITVPAGVTALYVYAPKSADTSHKYWHTLLYKFTVEPKDATYALDRDVLPGFVGAPASVITDQDINITVKDAAGHGVSGTLYYTVKYYNNSVEQTSKEESGVLALSSGAATLVIDKNKLADLGEGNDYVVIDLYAVDTAGYLYKASSFNIPVRIIKGVAVTSNLPSEVTPGTVNFNLYLKKADGLATGTFTLYYALLKAPADTEGLPVVPSDVTDVKAWLKEHGVKVVSATTPTVSIATSVNVKQAGELKVVAYVILTDENETSEDYETFTSYVKGWNVTGAVTAIYGQPVTIKLKVTDNNGVPINNAKVELYVKETGVKVVPDVFLKAVSTAPDYTTLAIEGRSVNISGGIYDFNAVYDGLVNFTANKVTTVYAKVYKYNPDTDAYDTLMAVDVPVVTINPAEDLGVSVSGEITPGVESNFTVSVTGIPSGVTYSINIYDANGDLVPAYTVTGLTSDSYEYVASILGAGKYTVVVTTDDGNHKGSTVITVNPVDIKLNKQAFTIGFKYDINAEVTYEGNAYTGYTYYVYAIDKDKNILALVADGPEVNNTFTVNDFAIPSNTYAVVVSLERNGVVVGYVVVPVGSVSIKVKNSDGQYVEAASDVVVGYAGANLTLEGKVAEADGTPVAGALVTVKVAGVTSAQVTTDAEGKFVVLLKPMAVSFIEIDVARDDFVEPFVRQVAVVMDREAPSITITQPANIDQPIQTMENTIKIAGTVSDNVGVDRVIAIVNGTPSKVIIPVAGFFSTVIDLEPGTNVIVLKVYDKNGNEAESPAITVNYTEPVDDQAPTITIDSPKIPEGMLVYETDQKVIVVKGTVTDEGTGVKAVYVNNEPVDMIGNTFAKKVELTEGANTITVQAIDYAGNVAKAQITVVYDPYLGKLVIELSPGSQFYKVNGETKVMDVAPFINEAGRTMVPVRFIAEAMGLSVKWDGEKRQVTISGEDTEVVLTIDSNIAMVDGTPVKMDSKAVIVNGRTFVPLRFVAEAFGFDVQWNPPVITLVKEK